MGSALLTDFFQTHSGKSVLRRNPPHRFHPRSLSNAYTKKSRLKDRIYQLDRHIRPNIIR